MIAWRPSVGSPTDAPPRPAPIRTNPPSAPHVERPQHDIHPACTREHRTAASLAVVRRGTLRTYTIKFTKRKPTHGPPICQAFSCSCACGPSASSGKRDHLMLRSPLRQHGPPRMCNWVVPLSSRDVCSGDLRHGERNLRTSSLADAAGYHHASTQRYPIALRVRASDGWRLLCRPGRMWECGIMRNTNPLARMQYCTIIVTI